jgi:Txe/YoeB family toxin of Txe-Axe toxin-antitoxin module
MNKPTRVILLDEADSEFKRLNNLVGRQSEERKENTDEMQLLKSIKQKIEFVKANPFYGDNIPKELIPKEYILNYGAKNLWRVELSQFWRMLYTIKGDQIEVICFVLDILNHDKYNKKFGNRKK